MLHRPIISGALANSNAKNEEVRIETWSINGTGWSLPVAVQWTGQSTVGEITFLPDVPLLPAQKRAILDKLETVSLIKRDGNLFLERNLLKQIGWPARVDNPCDVVRWAPREEHPITVEMTPETLEFLRAFCARGFISDLDRAGTIWTVFLEEMLKWLLIKNNVLDLSFVKLAAVPFRSNWKTNLLSKWMGKYPRFISRAIKGLANAGDDVQHEMVMPTHLAMSPRTKTLRRYIEVCHTRVWWWNVRRIELEAKQKPDYWLSIKAMMVDYFPYAIECLRSWLSEIVQAIPFDYKPNNPGVKGIPKGWREARSDLVEVKIAGQVCAVAVLDAEIERAGQPFDLASSEEDVSTV